MNNEYYVIKEKIQLGPYSKEYLKGLSWFGPTTLVWKEGFADWKKAEQVPELISILETSTPPLPPNEGTKKGISPWIWLWRISGLLMLILACWFVYIGIANNQNAIPGIRMEVDTPKPRLVHSDAHRSKSNLFNSILTVEGTILNDGGPGRVLVTAHVYFDGKDHSQTKSIQMERGEQKKIEIDFDQLTHLSGDVEYLIEVSI